MLNDKISKKRVKIIQSKEKKYEDGFFLNESIWDSY